ncbi:Ferritin-like metal-binding protein YciE [Salegentibacter agarivorans]|jgi:ferritin-like metal-binding protein YciE|uniref:Ferritin-like metal-binding protein YciE n=1 Tax=Salegentibacter agarivorans TaxID=345907 RepID=A0A1I2NAE5_9FLAO|nr:ferritin-like domain-containing protein [Salegentibacter agarivorans]SFG00834.1 Ferritin-like metal-binding protein YciE [Salegentibacter agarivorans]
MKTLKDLFEHRIKDLYSAEDQLIKALPKMLEQATNENLKNSFKNHLEETRFQKKRIEEVCENLNIDPSGEDCKAMKGLIEEAESFLAEDAEDDVKDAGIIAEAQRIEHYEISGYGTLIRYAKELGYDKEAEKLVQSLEEEYRADEDLNDLAKDKINKKAEA